MSIAEQNRLSELELWRQEQEPVIKKVVQQLEDLTNSLKKKSKDKEKKKEKEPSEVGSAG